MIVKFNCFLNCFTLVIALSIVGYHTLFFLAEQICLMPFYYFQDVYQKKQLGTRLDKTEIILRVNIISGKASVVRINGTGGYRGTVNTSSRVLGGGGASRLT